MKLKSLGRVGSTSISLTGRISYPGTFIENLLGQFRSEKNRGRIGPAKPAFNISYGNTLESRV